MWQFRINNISIWSLWYRFFLKELFQKHGFVQENLGKLRIEKNSAFFDKHFECFGTKIESYFVYGINNNVMFVSIQNFYLGNKAIWRLDALFWNMEMLGAAHPPFFISIYIENPTEFGYHKCWTPNCNFFWFPWRSHECLSCCLGNKGIYKHNYSICLGVCLELWTLS